LQRVLTFGRPLVRRFLGIAVLVSTISCGGGSSDSTSTPSGGTSPSVVPVPANSATQGEIGTGGGTLSLAEVASATFPAGAFASGRSVSIKATALEEAASTFAIEAAIQQLAIRSYEVRINTGEALPVGHTSVTLVVPQAIRQAAAEVQVLAEVDQFTTNELASSFEVLDSVLDTTTGTITIALPGSDTIFAKGRNDSGHEAVLVIAPLLPAPAPLALQSSVAEAPFIALPFRSDFDITSQYGGPHGGIDMVRAQGGGEDVLAVADGVVIANAWNLKPCKPDDQRCASLGLTHRGWGHYVLVSHADAGVYTVYGHLQGIEGVVSGPAAGLPVGRGESLGLVGATGGVTGAHLHLEYRWGGAANAERVDPEPRLRGIFDGKYTKSELLPDGFIHTETNTITLNRVTGNRSFSNGLVGGAFNWKGIVHADSANFGTISGSGTIENLGTRPFVLTTGGVELMGDGTAQMSWTGLDPMFGMIGGVAMREACDPFLKECNQ
jgi:murein DD-endopeptidase MepM/ murein hydrolase activator NlpD